MNNPAINLCDLDLATFTRLGIPSDILVRAGVERVTDHEARYKYGITGSGDMSGIVFPYVDPKDGLRKTARVRRDNPEIDAGELKRKYLSAFGDRRHLYFPPDSSELLSDPSVPIVFVEAEKSSLALTAWANRRGQKLLAIAMGGCWGWRGRIGKVENQRGERVDELGALPDLRCASDGRKTIILLDSNAATNPKVQQARRALALQLTGQGADVYVAELPAMDGVNGPDDYVGIAGDAAMATVLEAANPSDGIDRIDGKETQAIGGIRRRAQALLLKLGRDLELFHTPEREAFASFIVDGHRETWPIKSQDFAHVLRHRYYRVDGGAPPKQALEEVLSVFTSRALFDGPELPVFLRVAEYSGKICLDLADGGWNAVEISADRWEIVSNPPVKFRRPGGMRPLAAPASGGDVDELRSYLNVSDHEWPLVLIWLLAAYRPKGPYPILNLSGEQGSCKSTANAILRNLVDPNAANLRSGPRDERDLFIAANNSRVMTLDNLSHIPDWLSDGLCRLATGGGLATRQLYSDLNETIIGAQRPIILNGISELATRGDLLDRSLIISLPTIAEHKRRDEHEFWSEFDLAKPRLLGSLLSALAKSLAQLPHAKLVRKPRMADFALFGIAVERALGWAPDTFIKAYEANRAAANSSAIEATPVALAVLGLIAEIGSFEGTATELLNRLSRKADESVRQRSWPDSGWRLSCLLRRLAPNLRASGVSVTFDKSPDRKRSRIIRVNSVASSASDPSNFKECRSELGTHSDASPLSTDAAKSVKAREVLVADASDAPDSAVQISFVQGEI